MDLILRAPALAQDRRTLRARGDDRPPPADNLLLPAMAPDAQDAPAADGPPPVPAAESPERERAPTPSPADDASPGRDALHAAYVEAGERGFAEGLRQGLAEGEAQMAQRLALVDELAQGLANLRHSLLQAAEDDMVAIAFEAASRWIGEALASRDGILGQVRQALSQAAARQDRVTVRLHPADLDRLREADVPTRLDGRTAIEWVDDEDLARGGCVVHTPSGDLEARMEFQLRAVLDALLQARHQRPQEATE